MGKATMINVQTTDATNMSKEFSSMNQHGMGLGNNAPVRDLDAERKANLPFDRFKPEETKDYITQMEKENKQQQPKEQTTQGQHEQNLEDNHNSLDNLDNWTDSINSIDKNNQAGLWAAIEKMKKENMINDNWIKENINNKNPNQWKDLINKELNKQKVNIRDKINETKGNESYDNRTDEQKREDTLHSNRESREDNAYNRAVEDMRSAGLHPGLMFGSAGPAGSSGGSSSGSSKDNEENDKRKKKKQRKREEERYLAEMQAAKQRETMRLIGGMVNMLILGGTRGIVSGKMYNQKSTNNTKNVNKPKWTDKYMKELEDMEG